MKEARNKQGDEPRRSNKTSEKRSYLDFVSSLAIIKSRALY